MVLSLHRIVLGLPGLGEPFVGLGNYARLLSDPTARASAGVTLIFVAVSTLCEVALGTLMALALDKSFRGRGLVRAAVLVPWAIPTVVASQMWRFILNDRYGLLNWLIFGDQVGSYRAWLAEPGWALAAVISADVWKTSAFAALIVLAGLQTIPRELNEAAALDGAGPWQRFRHLTLPLVLPALAVALVFRTMDAFRVFDLVYVMTQGGPANATNVLQFYGYKKMFAEGFMGYGSAVSVMVFFMVLAVSLIYLRLVGRRLLRGDAR
ncbi:MAG: sugar ABC transporter permease [Proteobacteria bacterium]|nr:sugar ABC transporter permease [Pseudomonadota bacterium]MBU4276550.1 sugar ABC transporter permease [Pseudomonadota bacterium]MBU4381825.1 sugar ABC transporter permease [Pseudomonadota bacterium]MBU4606790.1 sugar ABC transporter permease [Pseudomonadota bacterium]